MASKSADMGFNINSFVKGSEQDKDLTVKSEIIPTEPSTAVRKSRKKSERVGVEVIQSPTAQNSMSYIQENIPYQMAYNETNQQLDEAIQQLNMLGGEIMGDLQMVRASKTLKNKYGYINDMTENAVGIINAKIAAIKEKNKTINDVNNLEIRRIKELKLQASEEDDNTRIANLYNAFINTPVGMGASTPGGMLGPSIQEMTMVGQGNQYSYGVIGGVDDTSAWQAGLDPAANRMLLEAKNAIETVVVYDEATGGRYFEVVDKTTRQPVPNVEKPDNSTVYELDINVKGGFAKDSNRNVIYPLVVINGNTSINEY